MCRKSILLSLAIVAALGQVRGQQSFDKELITRGQVKQGAFRFRELADSLSSLGLTNEASEYFLKISPWYFIAQGTGPDNLNDELAGYKLTDDAKDQYRNLFNTAYNKPRSETWLKLKGFEDQYMDLTYKYGTSQNDASLSEKKAAELKASDKAQGAWLYDFVHFGGWPDLENGAMFTGHILERDEDHWCDFLPYLKDAVLNGYADRAVYNAIVNFCRKPDLKQLTMLYSGYTVIDISNVLRGKYPEAEKMVQIEKEIKEHATHYWYFSYEYTTNDYDSLFSDNYHVILPMSITRGLVRKMNTFNKVNGSGTEAPLFRIGSLPAEGNTPAYKLYIFY